MLEKSKRFSCDGCGVIAPLGTMTSYKKRFEDVDIDVVTIHIYQFCRNCILKQPNDSQQ